MSAISWIQYNERVAGQNSPLYTDVANRPLNQVMQASGFGSYVASFNGFVALSPGFTQTGNITVSGSVTAGSQFMTGPIVVGTTPTGTIGVGVIVSTSATGLAVTTNLTGFIRWDGTHQTQYMDRGCGTVTNDSFQWFANNLNKVTLDPALNAVYPFTDGLMALGTTSVRWSALYATNAELYGTVGIQSPPVSYALLNVQGTPTGNNGLSNIQYGIIVGATFTAGASSEGRTLHVSAGVAASVSVGTLQGIRILDASLGAGAAVTTQVGLYIDSQTMGSTKYAILTHTGWVNFGDAVVAGTVPGSTLGAGVIVSSSSTALAVQTNLTGFIRWNGTNQTQYMDRGCGTVTNDSFQLFANNSNLLTLDPATSSLYPFTDIGLGLGTSSHRWNGLYVESAIVLTPQSGSGSYTFQLFNNLAGADQKNWDVTNSGSVNLLFRAVNDAYNAANPWLQVTRSATGFAIANVDFPNSAVIVGSVPTGTIGTGGILVSTSTTTLAVTTNLNGFIRWNGTNQTQYMDRGCGTVTNDNFTLFGNNTNYASLDVSAPAWRPFGDGLLALGTTSVRWSGVYAQGPMVAGTVPTGTIGVGVIVSTSASGLAVTTNLTGFIRWNGTNQTQYMDRGCGTVTNDAFQLFANNANKLTLDPSVNALYPFSDTLLTLGTSTDRWGTAYISPQVFLSSATTWTSTFQYTAGGADQKNWDFSNVGGADFVGRAANDAYNSSNNWLYVKRGSGFTIGYVDFPQSVPVIAGSVPTGTLPSGPVFISSTSTTGLSVTADTIGFTVWDGTHQTHYAGRGCGTLTADEFDFATNNTNRYKIDSSGNWLPTASAGDFVTGVAAILATNATLGFIFVPYISAGAPTGTPAAHTGAAALVYDDSNKKIWIYSPSAGAWKGVVVS